MTLSDCPRVFGLDVIVLFIDHLKQKLTFHLSSLYVVQPSAGADQQTDPDRVDGDPEDRSGQRCASGGT